MDSPTDSSSSASANVQSPAGSAGDPKDSGPKTCRVCGDRALGHNFNVVSCESCKAFFRRNALLNKEFRCPFNDNCDVSVISRKFCQKCRLRKCFEVGMKKDWIWTEEARLLKRQSSVNRRKSGKRYRYSETDNDVSSSGFVNSPGPSESKPVGSDTIEGLSGIGSPGIPPNLESLVASILYPRARSEPQSYETLTVVPQQPQSSDTKGYLTDQVIQLLAANMNPNPLPVANGPHIPANLLQQIGGMQPASTTPQILQNLVSTTPNRSFTPVTPYSTSVVGGVIRNPAVVQPSFSIHPGIQQGLSTGGTADTVTSASGMISNSSSQQLIGNSAAKGPNSVALPKEILVSILSHLIGSSDTAVNADNFTSSRQQLPSSSNSNSSGYPGHRVCVCRCSCGGRAARDAETNTNPLDLMSFSGLPAGLANFMSNQVYSNHFAPASVGSNIHNRSLSDGNLERGAQLNETTIDVCSGDDTFGIMEDSLYNMLDAAISSEFQMLGDLGDINIDTQGPVVDTSRFHGLTAFQQEKLDELLVANEILKEPQVKVTVQADEGKRDPKCLMDVINLTDIAIRRIIQMAKQIAAFKRLCQEDQIALLKGGCIELMILRGVMSYDSEKDSWHGPMSQYIKLDILKEVKGHINLYEEHKRYLQSFKPAWRSSEPIMVILGAITLFTPSRPHVLHPEVLRTEQEMYGSLLHRYLESVAPGCDAQNAYVELMQKVDELHQLNDNAVRVFQEVNPKNLEPLLLEIFDLKANSSHI